MYRMSSKLSRLMTYVRLTMNTTLRDVQIDSLTEFANYIVASCSRPSGASILKPLFQVRVSATRTARRASPLCQQ
jgi:hypothetical protein